MENIEHVLRQLTIANQAQKNAIVDAHKEKPYDAVALNQLKMHGEIASILTQISNAVLADMKLMTEKREHVETVLLATLEGLNKAVDMI